MAVFKCKMCGGTIEFENGATVGECDSCGSKQTLPKLDNERRINLYDRANHFRRNNEFDKAMGIYEQILTEDTTDAEAYWSLVLCRYGIEYVEDLATNKRVPTVNRAQFTSIFDDDNFKSAIQYADAYQKSIYEEEANIINEIQKGILAISQKEEPFDVFICYKETDTNGRRTPDSVLANDLYHQLTKEGFKAFFSRITLEDKLGIAYEPYIFAALNSSKVMVVLGTKPEYFNAVWVKNEWGRYLALVKSSNGKKVLIPAYKDMDPYDLPEEFSHLQAQDMSKLGFMQDLLHGIKKICSDSENYTKHSASDLQTVNPTLASLLKRSFIFLEDEEYDKADEYLEKILDIDPENAKAYIGKVMVEFKIPKEDQLTRFSTFLENNKNFKKAITFGDKEFIDPLLKLIPQKAEGILKDKVTGKVVQEKKWENHKGKLIEMPNGYIFGHYKSLVNGSVLPIVWQELDKNDNGILLISKSPIDYRAFNENNQRTAWEYSSLYRWLNNDFFNSAFDENERGMIVPRNTKSEIDLVENVSMLSIEEAERYFHTDAERVCEIIMPNGTRKRCCWWLRSEGIDFRYAADVYESGTISKAGDFQHFKQAVRPIVWIRKAN